jgi:exopolysaccharide biosynthesis polyprenyl glycosylphosphotransferase
MYQPGNILLYRICHSLDSLIAVSVLFAVFFFANLDRTHHGFDDFLALRIKVGNFIKVGALAWLWPTIFRYFRLYDIRGLRNWRVEFILIVKACSTGSLLVLALPFLNDTNAFRVAHVPWFWLGTLAVTSATRLLLHLLKDSISPHGGHARKLIIVGSSARACRLYYQLCSAHDSGYEFLGFVDSDPPPHAPEFARRNLIGELLQLETILCHRVVDEVLIALPIKSQYSQIENTIRVCERVGVEAKYYSDIFHPHLAHPHSEFEQVPTLSMKLVRDDYQRVLKRLIDLAGAAVGLLLLFPLMLFIALAIKMTSPGSVFFAQERYGRNKRRFRMYKFRTMVINAEQLMDKLEHLNEVKGPIFKLKCDPRITPVGQFLRKTSLDELPQLFNVLKGEMSLVGPRPLPVRDVSRFEESWLMRRFCVPPGLTCLWQISGRSNLNGDSLVSLDLEYIDKWSLMLDFQILVKTVPAVFRGTGAV